MMSAENLRRKFLIFSANRAEPGSQRTRRNLLKCQFQQGNSLLIRKKSILKNERFSCVERARNRFFKFHVSKLKSYKRQSEPFKKKKNLNPAYII